MENATLKGEAAVVLAEMQQFLKDFMSPDSVVDGKMYLSPEQSFKMFEGFAKMTVLLSKAAGMPPGEFLECLLLLYTSCPSSAAQLIKPESEA